MWHNFRWMRLRRIVLIAVAFCALRSQSLREACAKADEAEIVRAALANPALALRESELFLPLPFGPRVLARLALAAPDAAAAIADLRPALANGSPQMRILAALSADSLHDLPTRRRVAVLAAAVARGDLSLDRAWKIAADTPNYFARIADLREDAAANGASDEAGGYDRVLELESITICRGAQESGGRSLARDFAAFRATDIYLTLAYGGADCEGDVFPRAFDGALLPQLRGNALTPFLAREGNWKLREFTAEALDAGRFERLLPIAGAEALSKLAFRLDDVNDAEEVSEMIAAHSGGTLRQLLSNAVVAEHARAPILYGLLAARLGTLPEIGAPYAPLLESSKTLDTAALFGSENRCIERYFFWDDNDGVESFNNFLRQYDHDSAWRIENRGTFVHLVGRGAGGRTIEIYADIPIDIRLPGNREREGEALRRQAAISAELARRGLSSPLLVHRGHSYHVEKTLGFVTPSARLVVLGSCRGVPEIHRVIEASHTAQVIATRGTGAMQINDAILKSLNNRLLSGGAVIGWADFWREQQARSGSSGVLQKYETPDRDQAAAFLRAYYMAKDRAAAR